jgi:hypothetical protein
VTLAAAQFARRRRRGASFTQLTNGFSKKFENHCHALALYFFWYNWVRTHKTLSHDSGHGRWLGGQPDGNEHARRERACAAAAPAPIWDAVVAMSAAAACCLRPSMVPRNSFADVRAAICPRMAAASAELAGMPLATVSLYCANVIEHMADIQDFELAWAHISLRSRGSLMHPSPFARECASFRTVGNADCLERGEYGRSQS